VIILVPAALAAFVPEVPPDTHAVAVLACPADDACEEAAAWAAAAQGMEDAAIVPLDLVLERDNAGWVGGVDTRAALATAVAAAEAAAAKGRWNAVAANIVEARTALAAVRGDVNTQTLFTVWFLDGAAAVARGDDKAHEYSFRQAAALSEGQDVKVPAHTEAAARAWADERRKLAVGGEGRLALAGPPGTRWSIDGAPIGTDAAGVDLLPGNHRIVATLAGSVRSWQGDVPVLAGRTVTVTAAFAPTESGPWLQARLDEAFDTLQGPPALTTLLSDWARRHDLDAVRLVKVEATAPTTPRGPTVSGGDPLRPAAADGERVDHGDGIPSTYAEEVLAVDEAARARPAPDERRLRVMWFDPALQRFTLDAASVPRADAEDPRFRASLHLGYAGMMAHHHYAADLGGAWRVGHLGKGPFELEARLGLVRADAAYNLYPGWIDRQLYHASLGLRWAPDWALAPFLAAGPEVYVPVAFGGRVSTGAQLRIERRWLAVAELHGGWLDQGPGWGAGLSLGRSY